MDKRFDDAQGMQEISMKWVQRFVASMALCVLAACGGGGGGNSLYGSGDSTTTPLPTASSITLDLGGAISITNNGSDTVTATAVAKDANNVVVAGVPVSISSDSGDVAVAATATDSTGKVTATISIGADRSNRIIRITATSGALTQSKTFAVIGAKIKSTPVPSVVLPGASAEIQYQVVDVNNNPLAQQTINVASAAKTVAALTDSNGVYRYTYVAPSAATNLEVTAASAGATQTDSITVQAASGGSKPNVPAGTIQAASVEVNPSVVTVNATASTANQAGVRALFLGANNASIQNVRVRFDLAGDPNSVGGAFASGSSIVYSDANGEATTFYVPGSKASPTNGVVVRACYGYTDAQLAGGACPNEATTTLTVASGAVSVTIGTNKTLIELNSGLVLAQDFVVTVNDSAGRAKSGVDIVPSVDLVSFAKGRWTFAKEEDPIAGIPAGWSRTPPQTFYNPDGSYRAEGASNGPCWNEDRNRNGVLEVSEDDSTAGYTVSQGGNGNGALDPRKSDVLVTVNGGVSAKTDSTGSVVVRISYPRNLAGWIKYRILVSASGISGTEGRASWLDVLGIPLPDIKEEAEPAFSVGPYGVQAGCQNPN